MTAYSPDRTGDAAQLFGPLVAVITSVTGGDDSWAAAVDGSSRLEADLRLDSIEIAALGQALADRFGDQVDLAGYLAELSFDRLVDLTVADLIGFISDRRDGIADRRDGTADRRDGTADRRDGTADSQQAMARGR
jgi:acyl carrier protein